MMNSEQKLEVSLQHIDDLFQLVQDNEYEKFLVSHLFPMKFELERQLTNLLHSTKVSE